MTVPPAEARRRLSELAMALRESGLRLTHQRLEVAREISQDDTHPDVETIFQAVRERVPTISLDTVYRTIATLADLGLVDKVNAIPGPTRYDANLGRHHHFVCTRCGLIRDVCSPVLDQVPVPADIASWGTVRSVKVHLQGICKECEREEQSGGRRQERQE